MAFQYAIRDEADIRLRSGQVTNGLCRTTDGLMVPSLQCLRDYRPNLKRDRTRPLLEQLIDAEQRRTVLLKTLH